MIMRRFYVSWLPLFSKYLVADGGNSDAHQRTDDIEEAIGQIGEGRHTQDGGLRHTATAPGDKGRGNGGTIFYAAAQEAFFVASTVIHTLEHIGGKDDAQVLVQSMKNPVLTVLATSEVRVRVKGSISWVMRCNIPLLVMTPPKHIAHRIR